MNKDFWKLMLGKIQKDADDMTQLEKISLFLRDLIIITVLFFLIIRPLIIAGYEVPTPSMEPTIMTGTKLIGLPILYGGYIPFTDIKMPAILKIKRQSIVIFKFPLNEREYYVKRVIGLPGDIVEIRGKNVFVNGQLLDEPYTQYISDPLYESNPDFVRPNFGPITVPKNHYFVMGDNRDNSYDSREWGFVPKKNIFAAPLLIYWSYDRDAKKIRTSELFKIIIK
ncbi:MAG: signal peptidase I [Spirochaetes bacterium]|nr:signal peptidase I [Spirochaetota bacterium]MBP8990635.1 signal peptidase I [Spirochaetota bacterium]HNV43266.1 signal peptidase I [Exilispira sp.]HPO60061.1 signal peptidase I [Exilispira sp.]